MARGEQLQLGVRPIQEHATGPHRAILFPFLLRVSPALTELIPSAMTGPADTERFHGASLRDPRPDSVGKGTDGCALSFRTAPHRIAHIAP